MKHYKHKNKDNDNDIFIISKSDVKTCSLKEFLGFKDMYVICELLTKKQLELTIEYVNVEMFNFEYTKVIMMDDLVEIPKSKFDKLERNEDIYIYSSF